MASTESHIKESDALKLQGNQAFGKKYPPRIQSTSAAALLTVINRQGIYSSGFVLHPSNLAEPYCTRPLLEPFCRPAVDE